MYWLLTNTSMFVMNGVSPFKFRFSLPLSLYIYYIYTYIYIHIKTYIYIYAAWLSGHYRVCRYTALRYSQGQCCLQFRAWAVLIFLCVEYILFERPTLKLSYWQEFRQWLHINLPKMATFCSASDGNVIKIKTFLFQWAKPRKSFRYFEG